ncbi:flagellar hook-length control protein FliK [Desulfovirgula thermocuniculi]|uniref:flagellar hook-length control protein FliK n=1 Tax=Desulfovirgula thermocuniculi TaxID=348842 RepID=UPI0012EBB973|nr:flagellar hook-length control protein FliK [Desulfovirgula thermocuniculi]
MPRGEGAVQVINVTPAAAGSLLRDLFSPGQVVEVEVLEVREGAALVRVEGQVFWARGELPSSPAAFPALVHKIARGTLYLKRLPPPDAPSGNPAVPGAPPVGACGAEAPAFRTVQLLAFQEGELYLLEERRGSDTGRGPAALALRLRTPNLGETWVYLAAWGGALSLKVLAGSEGLLPLFEEGGDELKERLLALGFGRLHLEVATQKSGGLEDLLAGAAPPPYRPLDARV